jgi:hypothetical protein
MADDADAPSVPPMPSVPPLSKAIEDVTTTTDAAGIESDAADTDQATP